MWYCMRRWVVFQFDTFLQYMHNGEVFPVWNRGENSHLTFDANHYFFGGKGVIFQEIL